jgi:hypothetical protein
MPSRLLVLVLLLLPALARADEILAWDKITQVILKSERVPADRAKAALGMVRAAVDDAVAHASPMGGGASGDIAAAVAAHDVLVKLFPTRKASLDRRLDAVRVDLEESVVALAAAEGRRAAKAVLASEWSWRRAVRRELPPVKGPKVKQMSLPLHDELAPKSLTSADKR